MMRATAFFIPVLAVSVGLLAFNSTHALAQAEVDAEVSTSAPEETLSASELRSLALESEVAEDARAALQQLMDMAPSDEVVAYMTAEILRRGGQAIEPDVSASIEFYELAANSGNATAYRRLGDIYRTDETLKDPVKALAAYRSAADLGDANGAYRAGTYLTSDVAGPPDIAAAVEYLTLAAEAEYSAAYTRLGDIYRRGQGGLSPADAIPWYLKAAEGGSGFAFFRVADLYASNAAGTRQPDLAIDYYRKAIDAGYEPAKVRLGVGLANGSLVPNRRSEGVTLLQEATEAGAAGAAVALARMQLAGNGTPRDPATAVRTLAAAASNGDVPAARLLIQLRTTGGSGVSKNIADARNVLSAIPEEDNSAIVAFENAIVSAAEAVEQGNYSAAAGPFFSLEPSLQSRVLGRVYSISRNLYVYLLQHRLEETGHYTGALNGLLTASTIRAINQVCQERQITDACRTGPLSSPARRSFGEVVFQ